MSETSIALSPIIQILAPVALAIVSGAVTLGIKEGVSLISKWTGRQLDDANVTAVRAFANDQAAKAVAASLTNLAGESIDVGSPQVTEGIKAAEALIPVLMKDAGITSQGIADMITAEIGRLQAQAPPVAPAKTRIAPSALQHTAGKA
jgi:hypothetical protein